MGFPLKLVGPAFWIQKDGGIRGNIKRAIMRSERELVIDVESEGRQYSVKLRRDSQHVFRGSWQTNYGGHKPGSVTCRFFRGKSGFLVLGEWEENDDMYHRWADLDSIRNFPDEQQSRKTKRRSR